MKCSSNDGILMLQHRKNDRSSYFSWEDAPMTQLPTDQHITYQLQYRKCGKASCSTCRDSQGHGPYWYAYWREGPRLRSAYIGKAQPDGEHLASTDSHTTTPPVGIATAQEEVVPALV